VARGAQERSAKGAREFGAREQIGRDRRGAAPRKRQDQRGITSWLGTMGTREGVGDNSEAIPILFHSGAACQRFERSASKFSSRATTRHTCDALATHRCTRREALIAA